MKLNRIFTSLTAFSMAAGLAVTPMMANAQNYRDSVSHRQKTKNQWRNIGYGSAAVALYGLLKHNSTLTAIGAAGAGYSAVRYEHDRKSQSQMRNGYGYNNYGYNNNGYNNRRGGSYNYNRGRNSGNEYSNSNYNYGGGNNGNRYSKNRSGHNHRSAKSCR